MRFRAPLVLVVLGVGCAPNPQPSADGSVVGGTVAYRERMALPADAVVQVQLSDVSLQDVAAPLIAETIVKPDGRQVPLPFELRYDPGKIDPKRTYAVRATIRSAGQMLFTTTSVSRVITQGNPSKVDLTLMRVTEPAGPPPSGILGTAWVLEDLGGIGALDDAQATLEFPEPGKVAGSGSCNRFFGPVEISRDSIAFGALASTRMACVGAVATQEGRYLKALQEAERYAVHGATLLIYVRGMDQPLRFTRTGS